MATWPGTLPNLFQVPGFTETEGDNVIRTSMDVGPPKSRRRSSAAVKPVRGDMIMDGTQLSALVTFYETTTLFGSVVIDSGLDDAHGNAATWRFVDPPKYVPLGGDIWRVTLSMEILP